jgi:FMN-dependent oxidoreductase (nitrilotriacetate monooxygenase family)
VHIKRLIQKLEAGKFDAFFMADHLAVLNMPINALKRSHTVTSFEPFTLLSALAGLTEHIGLIATGSTTFDEPYHVARRFASLDHISGGRAGWNIVTTSNPDAALNFGLDDHMEHAERYKRAREFYDVVTGLWDSFADDAFVRDVEQGLYFDPARMHVLNHKGKYLSVRGPLNIARPVQGWPVIVQAGASEDGKQLAAETAEAVFTGGGSLADGQKLYADIKGRMDKLGRDRDNLKICRAPSSWSATASRKPRRTRQARQHGALRQRHRVALGYIGHRCVRFRSRWATSADPRNQCLKERPSAAGRRRRARQAHGPAARAACRRLRRAGLCRHARTHRRPDGGMANQLRQ